MPSCVYRKCTNYDKKVNKAQGISYHMFPTCEIQLQDWIAIVRRQRNESDWRPSKSSRICSDHFNRNDKYISNKGRTLLQKNVLPIIEKYETNNRCISPSSLDNVSIPEIEDILESPEKAALKNRIKKLILDKKVLQKKNKALNLQNKRLKNKLKSILDLLNILKKRHYISKAKEQQVEFV